MAYINFSKTSGVYMVATDTDIPKSYFGRVGGYSPNSANNGFNISIGNDNYTNILLTGIKINGVIPTTMSEANTLLNSLFSA